MVEEEEGIARGLKKAHRNSSRDDAEGMTDEMREDVMELLRAFDLPFIVAPFEAEAQCAVLEQVLYIHNHTHIINTCIYT